MIGISLLTLDPWTVGGTQTHARELVRALAEHGTLDYRVYVSEIAPEAAASCEPSSCRSSRRAAAAWVGSPV